MARSGFSLIELTIVLAIIIVLAAIAVPRFSRGVEGASNNALIGDLAVLHKAVETYAAEHGGRFPDDDRVADQLTQFTDEAGNTSKERDGTFLFGPYLRAIPPVPVGPRRGQVGIAGEPGPTVGWIYDSKTGTFEPNMTP